MKKCSIKHDQIEKPYKKFCFDFLFNLVLQIGAYSIYSDGVDAQFLTDSVERLKEEAKYYLENVIEGIPIELPDIDAYSFVPNKIIDALRDDQLFDKISGFSFFECDEEAKYIGRYVDDILGKKEYAIGISYFDDYEKAYPLIELSARKGYSHGISSLGSYYRNGVVVEKDIKKAISLYEQAVSKGSSFACYQLARIYESGNGVSIDKDKSNDYYEKSYYYAMHGICRDDIYSKEFLDTFTVTTDEEVKEFREINLLCGICGRKIDATNFPNVVNNGIPIFKSYPIIPKSPEDNFGNRSYCCNDCFNELIVPATRLLEDKLISYEEFQELIDKNNIILSFKSIDFIHGFVQALDKPNEERKRLLLNILGGN